MDLSALRTLESAKYGGMDGCLVSIPLGDGTPDAAESKPLAPMGTCIGANGLILLREPASLPLPRHCDVYSRALHCSDIHVYGIFAVPVMLRSMLIPPKFSLPRETFGGINMDLSALRTLESAKYGGM